MSAIVINISSCSNYAQIIQSQQQQIQQQHIQQQQIQQQQAQQQAQQQQTQLPTNKDGIEKILKAAYMTQDNGWVKIMMLVFDHYKPFDGNLVPIYYAFALGRCFKIQIIPKSESYLILCNEIKRRDSIQEIVQRHSKLPAEPYQNSPTYKFVKNFILSPLDQFRPTHIINESFIISFINYNGMPLYYISGEKIINEQ